MSVPSEHSARWSSPLGRRMRGLVYDYASVLPSLSQVMDTVRTELESAPALGALFVRVHQWGDARSIFSQPELDTVFSDAMLAVKAMVGSGLRAVDVPADLGIHGEGFAVLLAGPRRKGALDPASVDAVAARLEEEMRGRFAVDLEDRLADRISIEVGGGLVLRPGPEETFEDVLIEGLVAAEKSARLKHGERLQRLGGELESLLSAGGLEVSYEPVAEVSTGRVVGSEAVPYVPGRPSFRHGDVLLDVAGATGLQPRAYDLYHEKAVEAAAEIGDPGILLLNVVPEELVEAAVRVMSQLYGHPAPQLSPANIVLMVDTSDSGSLLAGSRAAVRSVEDMGFRMGLDLAAGLTPPVDLVRELSPYVVRIRPNVIRGLNRNKDEFELVLMVARFSHRHGIKVLAAGCSDEGEKVALGRADVDLLQGGLAGPPGSRPFPGRSIPA